MTRGGGRRVPRAVGAGRAVRATIRLSRRKTETSRDAADDDGADDDFYSGGEYDDDDDHCDSDDGVCDAGGNSGVHLLGSGKDDMVQSMVKATDLAVFLNDFMNVVIDLKNLVYSFQTAQKEFNRSVATKVDISPFYASAVVVDPNVVAQMGQTSLDLFNKVENDCRSIEGRITDLTVDLGLMDAGEETTPAINEPVFASKFHKLD